VARRTKRARQLRLVVYLLLGFSLLQYMTTGQVSWPVNVYHHLTATLQEYANRPDAGWRRASEKLEEIGAAREGEPVPEFDLTGRVVRVADGDTVSILDSSNRQHKVRLFGIDTPERDQPHGKASAKALAQLVDEKAVGVVIVETDSYGREVGTLYLGGVNINRTMVESGDAWWYRHYAPHEHHLAESEQAARDASRGLWANSQPVPPWKWRRGQRQGN
jgi:endonuclease YncB( thermonuclease family)